MQLQLLNNFFHCDIKHFKGVFGREESTVDSNLKIRVLCVVFKVH